jgi:CheY-like chemotaxis protein
MNSRALTLLIIGSAMLALPFLDPKDNRARIALFGVCVILTWRYVVWRFADTLPPVALSATGLYAWAFAVIEASACLGWTFGFVNLTRTKSRSAEASEHRSWLTTPPRVPRVDVMITTYNEEASILTRMSGSFDCDVEGATRNIGRSDQRRPAGLTERDYVAISVSDTGSGMTHAVAAKAFEPFFTTKAVEQGTGLGLSQVLGFAQQSGGEVRIDTRVGRGTTITILLPRSRESLPTMVDEDRPVPRDGKAATILVVDDDAAVRDLTVHALATMNYRVLAADNGRLALDVLRQTDTIDLALIDLVMPGMNGRQLATRMRASNLQRAILFMTGYDDLSGTDDPFAQELVIKKPFKLIELAAAVERALSIRDGERQAWNVTPIRQPRKS